ncbi:MAG: nuclear transport factor 2 family protein [Rhodovibrionaceae bacterium]
MSAETADNRASRDEAEIRALVAAVQQAHYDKDAAAIRAAYAPDAVTFDLAPPLRSAMDSDPGALPAWLDTWDGPIEMQDRDLAIEIDGDLAFAHGYSRLCSRQAGEAVTLWVRLTLCLRRLEGAWRVVHEHVSVPFYMDGSFKAALDLEPAS